MRLMRKSVLRTTIVTSVAAIEFAVVTHRPEFWMILAFTLAAVALACELWSEHRWHFARSHEQTNNPNTTAISLPPLRFSLRRMMIAVGLVAVVLWPVHLWLYRPYYQNKAGFHGLLADLAAAEAEIMTQRADQCLARSKSGTPWDDSSEEAEVLRICPYPSDGPRFGSWSEQRDVWQRAAARSRRAAQRHSRISDYYDLGL
jgi:hypothetical protein